MVLAVADKAFVELILMAKEDAFQLSEALLQVTPYSGESGAHEFAVRKVKELLDDGYLNLNRVAPRPVGHPGDYVPLNEEDAERVLGSSESWLPKDEQNETHYILTLTDAGTEKFFELIRTPNYGLRD